MENNTAISIGTEKQIKWAEILRDKLLADLASFEKSISGSKQYATEGFAVMFDEIRADLYKRNDAAWWISNHQYPNGQKLVKESRQYQAKKAARVAAQGGK